MSKNLTKAADWLQREIDTLVERRMTIEKSIRELDKTIDLINEQVNSLTEAKEKLGVTEEVKEEKA